MKKVRGGVGSLRTYQIYFIEDEFAQHFIGRERLFFNLFLDYIQTTDPLKSILQKQIEYVTKPIPKQKLESMVVQKLKKKSHFRSQDGVYYLDHALQPECHDGRASHAAVRHQGARHQQE